MKTIHWISSLCLLATGMLGISIPAEAQESIQANGEMGITFDGLVDPNFGIRDPEAPENELTTDEMYGKTNGPLRIDFVSNLNFNSNKIVKGDMDFSADALLFKDVIAPRGYFIQVSDYREDRTGWGLQVRQETQFTNQSKANSELKGAVLSFDKSWTNTPNGGSKHPVVSKEVIRLNNIGETYTLAKADKGTGGGTWSISFGASQDNQKDITPTFSPRLDGNAKPIIDPANGNQAVYMNDAVRLSIPGGTEKEPGTYSTVLTWIISELP
ncbi:WxL domain-containing protein [Enterococcus ureasiticus]|nr:WxL domain-containing protein [Enterococcus ureasiticus]